MNQATTVICEGPIDDLLNDPLTPEEWAQSALASAKVKKTKYPFLVPHIAHVIRLAIEDDRRARQSA